MVLAIIDLGSNSIRMDIVEIDEKTGSHRYIERCRDMARLSEGMNLDGNLQPEAIDRTIAALSEFKKIMKENNTDDVITVATAAVRKAGNSQEFIKQVEDETGIIVRVIKGEQEAEYDFLGVTSSLDIEDCVIVDTGGGSTEIILVNDGEPLARTSIPVGAVNMTEQFLFRGETEEALSALTDYIDSQLDKIHWLEDAYQLPIVGMGGSIYNLAIVENNVPGADRSQLHGCVMAGDCVADAFGNILEMNETERGDAGIEASRTDTIIAGVLPIVELINKIGSEEVIESSAGLKEGILAEFIESIK